MARIQDQDDGFDRLEILTKDMYAHYGLAVYACQCLEKSLVQLLLTLELIAKRDAIHNGVEQRKTRQQHLSYYDERLETLNAKTLGQLLKSGNLSKHFDQTMTERLQRALDQRNFLAHHFFWERAGLLFSQEGMHEIIEECKKVRHELFELDSKIENVVTTLGSELGVTKEAIDSAMDQLAVQGAKYLARKSTKD